MKGVILAGGKGTRLYPLTQKVNKHLLPVGREPMIFNPIKQLISSDITDILVITAQEYIDAITAILGKGDHFGCHFTFRIQKEPKGIANALLLAEDFTGEDLMVVILGDNITTHSIKPYIEGFKYQGKGAKVLLKRVKDPQRFGTAVFREGQITGIEEKVRYPKSDYAVVGIYMYDRNVYKIIKAMKVSSMDEWGITPVNNAYLQKGVLTYDILKEEWIDAGTLDSYQYANEMLIRIHNEIIYGEKT